MANLAPYPEAPSHVPQELAQPSSRYKIQTLMVLLALGGFVLIYFGLILLCAAYSAAALGFVALSTELSVKMIALVSTLPFLIVFIYLVKSLFKVERARKEFLIEIFADEQPRLFDFIHQICDETGAEYPEHVYIDYSVNAAAIPDSTSFGHLLLPTGKSLLIGLGVVNVCNLTEFKALLAHEFGHFAQKEMKLGGYIFRALRICENVVYGQDAVDRFINAWSKRNVAIAWPAWIVRGIAWCLRKILGLMLYVVYSLHLALKRQMEFNADLAAVRAAGSEGLVSLLHRCRVADACFNQAVCDLKVAMSQHLYTADLFHHQSAALGTPTNFKESDDEAASMWATHPPLQDRERNARACDVRTVIDERSPWLLFDNVEKLRERVTHKFYRFYFKVPREVILADPAEIQGFIDAEHGDRIYDARYEGIYDGRHIQLTDIHTIADECVRDPRSADELSVALAVLYGDEFKQRARLHTKRRREERLLKEIVQGWHRPTDGVIQFRGESHDLGSASRLLDQTASELRADDDWLSEFDRQVFAVYFRMALQIDREAAGELCRRYDFHLELQSIRSALQKENESIRAAVVFLNAHDVNELSEHDSPAALRSFRAAHETMRAALTAAEAITLPALTNLPAGQWLRPCLLEGDLVSLPATSEGPLRLPWILDFLRQFREMKEKVDRIHCKSLAGVLALQERIGTAGSQPPKTTTDERR